jgi:hypothetical protein
VELFKKGTTEFMAVPFLYFSQLGKLQPASDRKIFRIMAVYPPQLSFTESTR